MRLVPNAEAFALCYGPWLEKLASLVVDSERGTSFGIFGAWGSGKSSACAALSRRIHETASEQDRLYQCVTVDAFALSSSPADERDDLLADAIWKEVAFKKAPHGARRRKSIYRVLRSVFAPVLVVTGHAAAGKVIKALSREAEGEVERAAGVVVVPDRRDLDRAVVFIDDLDRCRPADAMAILAHINGRLDGADVNVVVACDPHVLAAHVAETYGISHSSGRDVLSKYVHVPFALPMGRTSDHEHALRQALDAWKCSRETRDTVVANVGLVPIREMLSAIPQCELWLAAVRPRLPRGAAAGVASVCLFLAILGGVFPMILRSAKTSLQGMLALRNTFTQASVTASLAQDFREVFANRKDLVELGARILGEASDDHYEVLTTALAAYG